ncbi:MAG: serine hydrolase [Deltaproteobacteria bacterium]|nr:serine hydrolase [Deltaproteobacteria bacterium]
MKIFSKRRVVLGLIVILVLIAAVTVRYADQQIPIGCAFKAKTLCAAVFVSGRDPESTEREDLGFNPLFKFFKAKIDNTEKSVICSLLGTGLYRKKAIYIDPLGSILLSGISEETIRAWKPAIHPPEPANPEALPWPQGDRMPEDPLPAHIDLAVINEAVEKVFTESDPEKKLYTRALIVAHNGRIIVERYGQGITKDTPLLSWSMAKSVTNALIGILVKQGKLALKEPTDVPEWQKEGDPRRAITLDQLLRMSSGLKWAEAYEESPVSDVNVMLLLKPDMGAYAASMSLATQPDMVWYYSSGTTNIISRLIRDIIRSRKAYWAFPRRELFNKIGMRSAVWETDATGTFIGSSYLYATARDYARFGLLYLNDGVWLGERILPEGWVAYSTTPTPAAPQGRYGAHFWLNGGQDSTPANRMFPQLPGDMFFARGYQGQTIAVSPSRNMVVVRLGMTYDENWGLEAFIKSILEAVAE